MPRVLLNSQHLQITLARLVKELEENHLDFSNTVLIGLQPRGLFFANHIYQHLNQKGYRHLDYGVLDPSLHRDDFRTKEGHIKISGTDINFSIEGKKVVLIDDVFFTGRTIRAGLDALLNFGRPEKVELMVLVLRRYSQHLPIFPDYIGKEVDTINTQKVKVFWNDQDGKDEVLLINEGEANE